MIVTAWRITHQKYANTAFTGEGAKLFGGRWNPPGYAAIYVSDSLSLAILELIVHLDDDRDIESYVAIPVEFEDSQVFCLPKEDLPENWATLPISDRTQQIGKNWLVNNKSLILKVPSSIVPQDKNFVINPLHPNYSSLKIGQPQSVHIDPRIVEG